MQSWEIWLKHLPPTSSMLKRDRVIKRLVESAQAEGYASKVHGWDMKKIVSDSPLFLQRYVREYIIRQVNIS